MNALQRRFLLFLGGCIPVRLAFVLLAKMCPIDYLPYMGFIGLVIAVGFIYLYFTGKRTTGLETQGAPIWWGRFRIIHGLLYLFFAIYAINKIKTAYQFLLADVLIGLSLFLWHHYRSGSFRKLI